MDEICRKAQDDKMYDKMESRVSDMASMDVEALGMENAPDIRKFHHKQLGGAGDDVGAREKLEAGMPEYARPLFSPYKLRTFVWKTNLERASGKGIDF